MTERETNLDLDLEPETDIDLEPPARLPRPRRSVRFVNLLLGIIPILAGLALVGAMLFQSTRPLKDRYEKKAAALLKAGKFAEAQACLKRLLIFDPDREEIRYALALAHERLGQLAQANEIMRALAPSGKKGFLPAHHWLAARLSAAGKAAPEALKAAEGHYLVILKEYPKSPLINRSLGLMYVEQGLPNKAMPHLLDVASGDPEVLLAVARCLAATGDAEGAARYRREALETSRKLAKENPKAPLAWLLWGQATASLKDHAGAFEILNQGEEATRAGMFSKAKAALCEEWSVFVLSDTKRSNLDRATEALQIVWKGLTCEPESEPLTKTMNLFLLLDGKEGDAVRSQVTGWAEARTPANAAAVARLALGNAAILRKQPEEALRQWELGYGLDPDLPVLANNYAWALAFAKDSDPAKALTVIDQAIKTRQRDPRLRGTRGLILQRLGRDEDAKAELRRALAGGNAHPQIKAALAKSEG